MATAGVEFTAKNPIDRKGIEPTQVKSIKLLTALDNGSKNDGTGKGVQPGMLYGNTYSFKVSAYTNGNPNDLKKIKWKYKYHSLSKDKWIEKTSSKTGDTYSLHLNEKDMCGRTIHVMAYINDFENEGYLKTWFHNRFRWFDRMMFEKELEQRTDNRHPEVINQKGTSLCGMAAIFYLFAKEQPEKYKKFSKDLFRTGEATSNSYTAKPSSDILNKKINTMGFPMNTGNMAIVDFVTLASTRNTKNPKYKGGNEEFNAINWPPFMVELCEKLLGYGSVKSKGVYNPVKPLLTSTSDMKNKIEDINKQFNDGYKLILMIDADLIQDQWDIKALDLHWVNLESVIKWDYVPGVFGSKRDEVMFKVYSWGSNTQYLSKPISWSHFVMNYNGYIKMK
ncbi:hypothetical protein [Kaistella carnis]|uniref:hypothetical protein n=1 Tax=Kaistella carnis TaxID=1241979 RepID=UPI0028A9D057|nr:hypothetical protein [Kaistella carnis]